jgi:flagellar basal-body rod protein FlgG
VAGTTKVFTQGTATNTGNPLDIEIDGAGFLQITYTDGTLRYSRDGAIRLNANNQLVNSDGFLVSPSLTIPSDALSVSISSDGTVSAVTASAPNTSTNIGQLTLARFPNPSGLSSQGNNLYAASPASGAPITTLPGQNGAGLIRQGFLEGSNVDVVSELVNLIIAQRSYEFDTRAVRVSDEMLSTTNGLIQ